MASITDVAKEAGVAKSTVSAALSGKKPVSDEIKQKIENACKYLNYVPNFYASNIMSNKSKIIGLFLETGNLKYHSFYDVLLKTCVIKARANDMQILPYFGLSEEEMSRKLILGAAPLMAAILLAPRKKESRVKLMSDNGLPFVVIGKLETNKKYNRVDVNNALAVYNAMKYVYKKGHKKILLMNSNKELTITQERNEGVTEFLKKNSDVLVDIIHCHNTIESGEVALSMVNIKAYDCIITQSINVAIGVYNVAEKNKLKICEDISVLALGGDNLNNKTGLVFNQMMQNYEKIAEACIDALINNLQSEYIEIESEMVEGNTVKDLNII